MALCVLIRHMCAWPDLLTTTCLPVYYQALRGAIRSPHSCVKCRRKMNSTVVTNLSGSCPYAIGVTLPSLSNPWTPMQGGANVLTVQLLPSTKQRDQMI